MPFTSLVAERKRLAKKRKVATAFIEKPCLQQQRNREAARAHAAEDRMRQQRHTQKCVAQAEAKRQADVKAKQQAAIAHASLLAYEPPVDQCADREVRTSCGPRQRPPAPSLVSEYIEEVSYGRLSAPFKNRPCSDLGKVHAYVEANFDVNVLCALPDGNGVRTWHDLSALDDSAAAMPWYNPHHWLTLSQAWTKRTAPWLRQMTESGNYNNVLVLAPGAPVDDPTKWPPQLRKASPLSAAGVCGGSEYVVRMTRTDPFASDPCAEGPSPPKVFRAMKLESLVADMALALHAASLGIGPTVYAAVSWKWDRVPGDKVQRYGLLLVLERSNGDMLHYQRELLTQHPPSGSIKGPPAPLRERAEFAGAWLAGLCYQVAWSGFISFDMKPGNILMCERANTFCITDFDNMYYRSVPDAEGGVKARFFVNLLLLCIHVRAYSRSSFTTSFLKPLGPELLRLWKEAVSSPTTFGAGSVWLRNAAMASDSKSGTFDHRRLARMKDPNEKLATMLAMMVFEYFINDEPPKQRPCIAARWSGWKKQGDFFKGPPPLVPQLLRFVLFYGTPVPDEYATLLDY